MRSAYNLTTPDMNLRERVLRWKHIHTHLHTYMHTIMRTCTSIHSDIHIYVRRPFTYTYIYVYIHVSIHTYTHTYKSTCTHIHACMYKLSLPEILKKPINLSQVTGTFLTSLELTFVREALKECFVFQNRFRMVNECKCVWSLYRSDESDK